ncbi:MAG: hypothetical protein AAB904_00400 [Patescibacteria group bacterium]
MAPYTSLGEDVPRHPALMYFERTISPAKTLNKVEGLWWGGNLFGCLLDFGGGKNGRGRRVAVAVGRFRRLLEGIGEASRAEAREELLTLAPGPSQLGSALGVSTQGFRETENPVAALAGLVGIPTAKDLELTARDLAIQIPHPVGRGLMSADAARKHVAHPFSSLARPFITPAFVRFSDAPRPKTLIFKDF